MKKIVLTSLLISIITICNFCYNAYSENVAMYNVAPQIQTAEKVHPEIVYITATGKKYHKENCRYLKYTKCRTLLEDAQNASYTSCKVCNP